MRAARRAALLQQAVIHKPAQNTNYTVGQANAVIYYSGALGRRTVVIAENEYTFGLCYLSS